MTADVLLVKCDQCGHSMKYAPKGVPKTKRCVYCGKNINTKRSLVR